MLQLQELNSPFSQEQTELLNRLLPTLTETQRIWLSGYIAALPAPAIMGTLAQSAPLPAAAIQAEPQAVISKEVTVLYGSQTGNSHGLAKKLTQKLEGAGFQVTLAAMNDFKTKELKNVENLFILVSTHGEGDPPDNALPFYEFLHGKRAPKLDHLQFSVLSLGDSSYEFFCKTGQDFDKRLEELGGKRLAPRVDCDLDYDEPAEDWFNQVVSSLNAQQSATAPAAGIAAGIAAVQGAAPTAGADNEASLYSRTNPFHAEVLENLNLNGRGSDRETRHLEISLEGSNLQYEPGDCLGIYPQNHPELVSQLIEALGSQPHEVVTVDKDGTQMSLRDALTTHYEITVLTKPLLEKAAELTGHGKLKELLAPERKDELRSYIEGRDVLDLIQDFGPWSVSAADFVAILRKMPARLYSIASSNKANPDEAHLTIRTVNYQTNGRQRFGVCSTQVAERVEPGDTLPVYIHQNPNFKLPANPDTPIIMIGPGTGVAPFRAFLEEREELGAEGKSWLFFGDRHFVTDFLYQVDWQRWLKDGVLTKMDVAFSRDTAEKVYVQHRMLENSKQLYQWITEGAHIYVCGDEKYMAHDVQNALLSILETEGGMSPEQADAYLKELQQQKRYQRDVY